MATGVIGYVRLVSVHPEPIAITLTRTSILHAGGHGETEGHTPSQLVG
jgi:hypothetical protein